MQLPGPEQRVKHARAGDVKGAAVAGFGQPVAGQAAIDCLRTGPDHLRAFPLAVQGAVRRTRLRREDHDPPPLLPQHRRHPEIQRAADHRDVRLGRQSPVSPPLPDILKGFPAPHGQEVLGAAGGEVAQVAPGGDEHVGMAGQLLEQPPVPGIGRRSRHALAQLPGRGGGDAAIQADHEIAVDEERPAEAGRLQRAVEIESVERRSPAGIGVEA